jgi:hypothetical protein
VQVRLLRYFRKPASGLLEINEEVKCPDFGALNFSAHIANAFFFGLKMFEPRYKLTLKS